SGGGQIGNFHMVVLKALTKEDLLTDVISGASAGSLYAALVGTHTNEELLDFFAKDQIVDVLRREAKIYEKIAEQKSVKVKDLEIILENVIPDITFQEAFHRTGRKINISIAPYGAQQKSRLLNAIASPNVLIRSAVMASCAVPGIFPPVTLSAKNKDGETRPYLPSRKWIDGSMSNDLPSKRLTRLYQVNHFIVSLTNPLVLPFVMDPSRQEGRLAPVRRFGMAIMKETTQFNYSIAKRFFKYAPSVALFANNVNSIVQQNYLGDINILADFSVLNARKVLSSWTFEELNELIRKGEKATWSKIEAIRVTTKIGRTLDDILEAYETKEMALANGVLNE
ncbi:MAG: patatin-like phospholipase family protein, partial [Bacteroidota bacterium]